MKFYSLLTGELASSSRSIERARRHMVGPLWQFIFHTPLCRRYLIFASTIAILQLIIFKILYPFPDFISDSYSYISTNLYHMDVNLWPVGYSKFLWLVHLISHSDLFLVAIQFIILEAALAYFFYTILYLYQPAKYITISLFIFLFLNPIFIYLSNCVLSDAVFTALTLIFLGQFLWMIHRPTTKQIIIQGLIIGVAFTIRYTAVYYPLVAIAGFIFTNQRVSVKIWGSLLGITLMIPFYLFTVQKTKEITGTSEFSVFGGWQIANNALYMYDHIKVDTNKLPSGTIELDRLVRRFYSVVPAKYRDFGPFPGTYFIKVPYAVLKPYMFGRYTYDSPPGQFHSWGMVSPIYRKYGTYLILHFPLAFGRYYLWLNTKNYFLPHLEKFGSYNLETNTVPIEVQDWFDLITPEVYSVSSTFQGKLFYVFPIIFMALNLAFIGYLIRALSKKRWSLLKNGLRMGTLFIVGYLIVNFAFSIFATPIVLRYQIVPMILLFTFSALLMDGLETPRTLKYISKK